MLCAKFGDNCSKFVVLAKKTDVDKIQNGGKSIKNRMDMAYMQRCVMSQGIQGKRNFHVKSYASRVTGQNVKQAVRAPP